MLANPFTLTFKEADGTTDRTEVFDKKTEDANIGIFNNHATVIEPSLPMARITFKTIEAKASGLNLGVRRQYVVIRHEVEKETPAGLVLLPQIEKFESSSPVQFTRDEKLVQWHRLIAVVSSDHFRDNYLELQC